MFRILPWIALAVATAPAGAQVGAQADSTGRWSLSVAFPAITFPSTDPATSLGIWRMVSRRLNLGLGLGVRWTQSKIETPDAGPVSARLDDTRELSLSVEPAARIYLRTRRPVKPFVLVGAGVDMLDRNGTATGGINQFDTDEWFGRMALGVEWFPVAPLSLALWTGVQVSGVTIQNRYPDSSRYRASQTGLSAVTSALTVQLYF